MGAVASGDGIPGMRLSPDGIQDRGLCTLPDALGTGAAGAERGARALANRLEPREEAGLGGLAIALLAWHGRRQRRGRWRGAWTCCAEVEILSST